MSTFGRTLFGGSPFIRWSLTPVILFFALWLPAMSHNMTAGGFPILIVMEIVFVALLGGFWLPEKTGRWCFRAVTAIVFLACVVMVIDAFSPAEQTPTSSRANKQSPYNSLPPLLLIGLPCLWHALSGRFSFRPEASLEQLAAAHAAQRQALNTSLLQPDWDFYEHHLQRPAPAALRALYADQKLITSTLLDYSDECSINTFEPLNESSLYEGAEDTSLPVVVIATTDFGDPIYLKPGRMEPNAVYVTHHDGGDTEVLADSVSGFVARLKQASKLIA